MLKKFIFLSLALCAGKLAFAQESSRALPFLEINADARTAGMGDANMGDTKSMFIYNNPSAFLNNEGNIYASYTLGMYPKFDEGRNLYHAVSAGYKILNKHAIMIGVRNFGGIEIPIFDENGIPEEPVKPNDLSVDLSYALKFNDRISAFIGGGFIRSFNSETASTVGFNAGVYYRDYIGENTSFNIGIDVKDLGGSVKYGNADKGVSMPSSIGLGGTIGFGLAPEHQVNAAFSTRYYMLPSEASEFVAGIGAEYAFKNMAAIRAGYHVGNSNNYFTAGVGVNVKFFSINAAYSIASQKDFNLFRLGVNFIF